LFVEVPDDVEVGAVENIDGTFTNPTPPDPTPEPEPVIDPCEWLVDIGTFMDRFGASKLPILMSADPLVKALVSDIQCRKWIDLQRADVAQALDALISKSLVTAEQKTAILETPVTEIENMALRKLYFS